MVIESFKFAKIQELAITIDSKYGEGNQKGNGKIDEGTESAIFKYELSKMKEAAELTDNDVEEVKEIWGLTTSTNPIKKSEAPTSLSKDEKKEIQNAVKDRVKKLVKVGVAPEEIINLLGKEFQNPDYKFALDSVAMVLNAVNETNYQSKDDVNKISDTVKKQLKAAGCEDDFHKDLLKEFVKQAENVQKGRELEEIKGIYKEILENEKDKDSVRNYSKDVKAVEENLKNKNLWKTSYYKDVFDNLFKNYVISIALNEIDSKLPEIKGDKDKIKDTLKAEHKDDDIFDKALDKRKKEIETFSRGYAIDEKSKKLENISPKDIKDKIGDDLFEKLNRSYLPKVKNEDGTYNLSALSDEIMTRVGIDNQVNRSKDKQMAELTNIQRHLISVVGLELEEKEVKKLMDLCEIKMEKKDRSFKTILNKGLGGIPGLITTAAMGMHKVVINASQHQSIIMTVGNKELKDMILESLGDQAAKAIITQNGDSYEILISQEQLLSKSTSKALLGAALGGISVLTNMLWALAFGEDKEEQSCISISDYDINDPKYTDAEQYKEYIATIYKDNPTKVKTFQMLVDCYQEQYGDEWHTHYWQKLREMAGIGSKLNPDECRAAKYQKPEPPVVPPPVVVDEPEPEKKCKADMTYHSVEISQKYNVEFGDTWAEIVTAFYPCLVQEYGLWGNGGAIKRLQRALCTDENGKFDKDKFNKLVTGSNLPRELILPAKIEDCVRDDNAKVKKVQVSGDGKSNLSTVGFVQKDGFYVAKDKCNPYQIETGETEADALLKLEKRTGITYENRDEYLKDNEQ